MGKSREESLACQDRREDCDELDRQYHEIGISAVAAAVRYQEHVHADELERPFGSRRSH